MIYGNTCWKILNSHLLFFLRNIELQKIRDNKCYSFTLLSHSNYFFFFSPVFISIRLLPFLNYLKHKRIEDIRISHSQIQRHTPIRCKAKHLILFFSMFPNSSRVWTTIDTNTATNPVPKWMPSHGQIIIQVPLNQPPPKLTLRINNPPCSIQ